ncbi:MAG: PEGA domain-containing protein [Planctomycetota bacterium]|nr:PEGA domain-containing protein [Planctomycetota bacterium]
MSRRSHLLGAALAALAFSSCIKARRPIVLDSTPPGAVIFVDGESSGHSTPCNIQLPGATQVLEFRLDGYEPEFRVLRFGHRQYTVYWRDAASAPGTWTFPAFLTLQDAMFPVKLEGGEMPHRIHVRLARENEPTASAAPVGTVR